jgi:DNA-binding NtrC family response regulator
MYTILVVDDEKVIRDGCSRVLGSEGYRVLTATNGREALEVLAAESVHAVLCGLKMPVMGAVEVLERVRRDHPGLPLIIITGQSTVANAVECMKKGAYDFIGKPFRAVDLLFIVRRAVEGRSPWIRSKQLAMEE